MSHHVASTALGLWLSAVAASAGFAQDASKPLVVVELFTSQGCSSCPPADEYFGELVKDDRILPLSLHVDYWDYIGWADSFASAAYTERQQNYARKVGSRMVYTPQVIVGGVDRVEGNDPAKVGKLINAHLGVAHPVKLTLARQGEVLAIHAESARPLPEPLVVQLIRYTPQETVTIERGENAGRTMTYYNIVTSWEKIGDWAGPDALDLTTPVPGGGPVVVILQEQGPSKILAAAQVE